MAKLLQELEVNICRQPEGREQGPLVEEPGRLSVQAAPPRMGNFIVRRNFLNRKDLHWAYFLFRLFPRGRDREPWAPSF